MTVYKEVKEVLENMNHPLAKEWSNNDIEVMNLANYYVEFCDESDSDITVKDFIESEVEDFGKTKPVREMEK